MLALSDFNTDPYAYQLRIISERWPQVAVFIDSINPPNRIAFSQNTPETTIVVDGIHMCSAYDAQKEACLQATQIPNDATTVWVYGVATDDLIVELLKRSTLKVLNIVLISPAVFRECLRYFDQRRWLNDPRVMMLLPHDRQNLNFPYTVMPACLRLIDDNAVKLRDLIVADINAGYSSRRIIENEIKNRHIESNIKSVERDQNVTKLYNKYYGKTIYVAGAGPTLISQYEKLRESKSEVLICVDAALKPLIEAGIEPNYVVSIDAHETIIAEFLKCKLKHPDQVSLIYFPTLHPDALNVWKGPRYAAYSPSPLFSNISLCLPRGILFSSGSVIHPAIDLAVKMGAHDIKLCGVDLSYPRQQSHVTGSRVHAKVDTTMKQFWVFNGYGDKVASDPSFLAYLRDLELFIKSNSTVKFTNLSRDGARIEGTCYENE